MTPLERAVAAAQTEMENSSMPIAVVRAVLNAIREPSEPVKSAFDGWVASCIPSHGVDEGKFIVTEEDTSEALDVLVDAILGEG